jgi:hypothetical protein
VKSQDEIEKRLRKLRLRYAHKYMQQSQERRHCNCKYNEAHYPRKLPYTRTQATELPLAPRDQVTLVVLQEEKPVRLCMFNADDSSKWQGNVCDSDDVSKSCPMFKPRVSPDAAKEEFLELVGNDEYVFDNYRDVATLQWVLGERVHEVPLSWWERFTLWLRQKIMRVVKPIPALPPAPIPEDLWNDPPPHS